MARKLFNDTNLTKYIKENELTVTTLNLTEEKFLELPWDDSIRKKLKEIIHGDDYKVLCAVHDKNKLKAVGFKERLEDYPENCVGLYFVPSRTQKAVRLVENEGYSVLKQQRKLV